ncbi:phage portal protein [Ktedonospora formicarum]|uniref:Phage portal protein n=1 Tax=Ktedonospora formicarum TaxID=2778364 RepID=A0A8J3MU95_9CHLR|nr:phage portal protein [Ktedonospora formicarum]GHO45185.1 hypothetical protein KSX_33480 [Ktedonospora formicarum]
MSLINKAFRAVSTTIKKASRGSLTDYVINALPEYGQPLVVAADASGLISPQRMREIVRKTPTVAACMNAILDYCANVQILVRNIDPAKPADPVRSQIVEDLLRSPNDLDTGRHFMSKMIFDLAVLGWAGIEMEMNRSGKAAKLHVVDGARLYVDYDEHGDVKGYDMLDIQGLPIHGTDGIHAWEPDQLVYMRRDAVSNSVYPLKRLEQLFSCAIIEDMMLAFIGGKFTESNVPYGVYDLGDVSETELKMAVDYWNNQATSNHRIIMTGSRGGSTFTQFGYALKDLDATNLLADVRGKIMAILGVTLNELGDATDVNKSNGYNLSYTFKRRAIEPLLTEITSSLSARLVHLNLGFKDLDLYFEEIDSRDELLQAQIDELNWKIGVFTVNHIRNRKGEPSVKGGDDAVVQVGTTIIPVDLIRDFAQAQLDAIQAEVEAMNANTQLARINPPALQGPQPPGGTSIPDSRGSSRVRISYPSPKSNTPQQARGPVQANRNAGLTHD